MRRKISTAVFSFVFTAVVVVAAMSLMPGSAGAYEFWDTAGTSDCAQCHSGAGGFGTFGSTLHGQHTAMVSDCDTCHPSGPGSGPVATNASGPITGGNGVGCIGCHTGPGLREHHRNVTPQAATCGGCHTSPETAAPESTLPPYYATADVNGVDDPCNTSGLQNMDENWDGNTVGLDNDGDTLYDGNDPDCGGAPTGANYNPQTGEFTSTETKVGGKAYNTMFDQSGPGFTFSLANFSKVTPSGSPSCTYTGATGVLECPDVTVTGLKRTYNVIFDQLTGFTFVVRSAKKNP